MACSGGPETEKTAIHTYYELMKTIVFWTNVCLALFVLVTGKYSIVIRFVEKTTQRIVWMVRGKPLDLKYFEEDTVYVRQQRIRERNEVDRHVTPTLWERQVISLSADRQRTWIYDLLEKVFDIYPNVIDTDDDQRDSSIRSSKTSRINLRLFRNLNTINDNADVETVDKTSQIICAKCGQIAIL